MNAESKYSGSERLHSLGNDQLWVSEQEKMAEGGAEVGSVDVGVLGAARMIDLVTARAEDLHTELTSDIRQSDGQHRLALTQRARTAAKIDIGVFVVLD